MQGPKKTKRFRRHFHAAADIALSPTLIAKFAGPVLLNALVAKNRAYGGSIKTMRQFLGDTLVLRIDPKKITSVALQRNTAPSQAGLGPRYLISAGDWDLTCRPLRKSAHIDEILDLFENDLDYERTASFHYRMTRCSSDDPTRHRTQPIDTEEKVHDYFKRQLALISSIQRNGYLSRRSVFDRGLYDQTRVRREKRENEIGCAVGRKGDLFMYRTGHHRLAIAVGLGLDEILVDIHHIHKNWLTNMMTQYETGPAEAIIAGLEKINQTREPA